MKITVESAYGNFALVVGISLSDLAAFSPTATKLVKLGLASEIYRVGNSAIDKAFAPKKENAKGKLVADMKEFKRDSVAYSEGNGKEVREVLTLALQDAEYEEVEVVVREKVRGEEAAPMKRAREMVEKARGNGTSAALAMLIGYEGEDESDEVLIPLVHAWMNPKK